MPIATASPTLDEPHGWLNALRWVMTRPGLITDLPGGTAPLMRADDPRLDDLLAHTRATWPNLQQQLHRRKLGLAFESLIAWGMVHGLGWEIVGRDVQVFEDKRTVGALDLVVRDPSGAVTHWELAYKLYLQCEDSREWDSWLGPAGRDRLGIKLRHMLTHQLPLSSRPEAVEALRPLGVDAIDHRRIMLQGSLFTPWGAMPVAPVDGHQPAEGRWLREVDLPRLLDAYPDSRWVPRTKPLWFGPASDDATGISVDALRRRPPLEHALLLSRVDEQGDHLVFVVPSAWNR